MDSRRNIFKHPALMLPLIIVFIGTTTAAVAIATLFSAAIEKEKSILKEVVRTQAHLIKAVAEFDMATHQHQSPQEAFKDTMGQVVAAHKSLHGFGESGEFVIGKLVDGEVAILQQPRFEGDINFQIPEFVPIPMFRALVHGETGTTIAQDYWGNEVLAAYEAVPILGIGLVAKIDTDEVYGPFIFSASIVAALTIVMLVIGVYASRKLSAPFKLLEISETRFNQSHKFANIGTWDWNIQTGDLFWSDRIAPLFGYKSGEIETTYDNFVAAIHPDDRQLVIDAVNACVEKNAKYSIEHRVIWPDGKVHWLHESGDTVRDEDGNPLNMLGVVRDITEKKMISEEIGRLNHRNKMILDAAGDGIYGVDLDGLCTFVNPAAARMTGWEAKDMIGLSNHDILHHTKADGSPYPREDSPIYGAFRDGKVRSVSDEVFWRKDGTSFPVEYTSTPIFEDGITKGAVVVFRDVSEQQKAKQALQEAFEFNETIFANSPVGIAIYDPTGQCILANEAIGDIIGATREQVLSQNYHDVASWKAGGLYEKVLECLSTDERLRHEVHTTTTFGKHTDLDCHLSPLNIGDQQHLLLIFSDITEARHMQEQLIQSSKLATLGEMATGVAHELNQPLNVIRMAVGNIQKQNEKGTMDADYVTTKLNKVVSQIERASAIIDHMRIFGRKPEKEMATLDPEKMISGSLDLIGEQLRLVDIEVKTDIAEPSGTFLGHQVQVEQVLLNLLANARDALQAKEDGEKCITLSVTHSDDGKNVLIEVEDTGGGIDPDVLPRIFEPFYTTKEVGQGTGLGLSISYGIIKDMGGKLEARNSEAGACFAITLPAIEHEKVA